MCQIVHGALWPGSVAAPWPRSRPTSRLETLFATGLRTRCLPVSSGEFIAPAASCCYCSSSYSHSYSYSYSSYYYNNNNNYNYNYYYHYYYCYTTPIISISWIGMTMSAAVIVSASARPQCTSASSEGRPDVIDVAKQGGGMGWLSQSRG